MAAKENIASIEWPQELVGILPNNSNNPFNHVALKKSDDGSKYIHPLEELSIMDFIDKTVSDGEPVKPPPVETTSLKLVENITDLVELAAKLHDANEFAVVLEQNTCRSFLGSTCLMQVSTRTEDFIVDTVKLKGYICTYLQAFFRDPSKTKVMHEADQDILWLQRDFDTYVCNMFDTQQASRVLGLNGNSLDYLLQHYCEIEANNKCQDWLLRPLTDGMLREAGQKTHYLLYIYDRMKTELLSSSGYLKIPEALEEVYKRSSGLCMKLYDKETVNENSYKSIHGLAAADLNSRQLAIVAGLYKWRDSCARSEDERTDYILPDEVLIEIAKKMPATSQDLSQVTKSKYPYLEKQRGYVLTLISRIHKEEDIKAADKKRKLDQTAAPEDKIASAEGTADGSSASTVRIIVEGASSIGAMSGKTAGETKFNLESKPTEEIKDLLHPFADKPEHWVKESTESQVVSYVENPPNIFPVIPSSKAETILLESKDKNPAGSMAADDQSAEPKKDVGEESMLSSFQKYVPAAKENIASIEWPQELVGILPNNSNNPFNHVALKKSDDGSKYIHPLEELSIMDFIDKTVSDGEPVKPPPVETTSLKLVENITDLVELAAKLHDANEFAVVLEQNTCRSFLGSTCLMQVSTRTEDFIVDTVKLKGYICTYLQAFFRDPSKTKVMHEADQDILWLQRDFDTYVCNMFDTQQASRVLGLNGNSLDYLLQHYCEIEANNKCQDWLLRPLTDGMLREAGQKTHYLLYIYDRMKTELLSSSGYLKIPEALEEVYKRSSGLCMKLYDKETVNENSYKSIHGLAAADLNSRQLAIVAGLYKWRDSCARSEDERTDYILPDEVLIEIAKKMPATSQDLSQVTKSKYPYLEKQRGYVLTLISRIHKEEDIKAADKKRKLDQTAAPEDKIASAEGTAEGAGSEGKDGNRQGKRPRMR